MSLSDTLDSLASPGQRGSDLRATNTPEAWRPRSEVDLDGGYIVSKPRSAGTDVDMSELLREFDLDPDQWSVTNVRKSRWQAWNGDWLEASRVSVVPANRQDTGGDADLDALIASVERWRPGKAPAVTGGDLAFVFVPADQQLGKRTGVEGTRETVERILSVTEGAVQRLKDLRKIGRSIGTVVIVLPGDHVEGNVSQGGRLQSFSASDLGLTEQTRVGRRLLMAHIKAFAPLVDRIIVAVVNGNHDEVSRQVKLDPSEGWNTEIASAVQDACAENPALAHVEFRYPARENQTLAIDVCGTMVGIFHGHQFTGDVMKYLTHQSAGRTPLGGCDVWISGHYHHFQARDIGERLWLQCPALDTGSAWFRDRHGLDSHAGVLTLVVGDGHDPRADVSIIRADRKSDL